MIGLIKLIGVDDNSYYINPMGISLFANSSPDLCRALGADPRAHIPGCSVIVVNGLPLQVRDNPQEIVSSLTRLKRKQEDSLLELKKRVDRDEWQDDEDFEEEEEV